jgi:hypothetical protein
MIRNTLSKIYDKTIRKHLPRRIQICNGIGVRSHYRLFDLSYSPSAPDYEAPLCEQIREHVRSGDHVTVVGGGRGVSTALALEHSHPDGEAVVYEASASQCEDVKTTLGYQGRIDQAEIRHAAIGSFDNAWGDVGSPEEVPPQDLGETDVLISDCEGAEQTLLENLEIRPRVLIVESHGCFDSPTDSVRELISDIGYRVKVAGWEGKDRDIAILTGQRDNS